MYSVIDKESFKKVDHWIKRIKDQSDVCNSIMFVGNKVDLKDEREISVEDG